MAGTNPAMTNSGARFDLMAGHRPFKKLTKGFSEARQARVVARVSELKHEMALHELHQARERSQQDKNS